MPIRINGTNITVNRINGANTTNESVNGNRVYGSSIEWSFYAFASSTPPTGLIVNNFDSSEAHTSPVLLEIAYPAASYSIGSIGAIYYVNPNKYVIFITRSV